MKILATITLVVVTIALVINKLDEYERINDDRDNS